ncbi:MAG: fluoride efflux transporter CrcB [Novosphingobium sp.]|nr:fluoride efflux transporter CrcB [Novosphingobium sp.]
MNSANFLSHSLLVAVGGGTGAFLRHMVGKLYLSRLGPNLATAFPWSTLTCNVLGSFAMGLLAGWLARHGHGGETWRLLLGVGLLGGFTTFSSFSLEFALLIERGAMTHAVAYVGVSLLAGFAGLFLGLIIMRTVA